MKNLNTVDCLKLLMAYAVIAIHSRALAGEPFPGAVQWFISLAVPFFFLTSGYLLGRKLAAAPAAEHPALLRRQSLKLFRLFGKWLLIYLPVALYYYLFDSPGTPAHDILSYAAKVIFDGESPYAWPLWFIYSMAIVLLLLSFALRFRRAPAVCVAIFATIYLVNTIDLGSITDPTMRLGLKIFDRLTVRTLGGGLYVCAGIMAFRHGQILASRPIAGALLLLVSAGLFGAGLPFSPLLGGVALLALALRFELPDSTVYPRIRAASMWIYYIHMLVFFPIIIMANLRATPPPLYATFAYGAIASTLAAIALVRFSRRPGFGWLAKLVS